MKKIFILILPLILLGACSTNPVLPKKDDIKISREAPTDACQDLGSIEGRTTKMNGKTEDALEDMKEEAIKKGANYVKIETIGALGTSVRGNGYYCK